MANFRWRAGSEFVLVWQRQLSLMAFSNPAARARVDRARALFTKEQLGRNPTRSRDYSIHLPSSYGATKAFPLVLCFHGSNSVGVLFEAGLSGSKYSAEIYFVHFILLPSSHFSFLLSILRPPSPYLFPPLFLNPGYEVRRANQALPQPLHRRRLRQHHRLFPVGGNFAAFAAGSGSFYTDAGGVSGPVRLSQTSLSRRRPRDLYDVCLCGACLWAYGPRRRACPCAARCPLPVLEIHGGSDTDVPHAGGAGEGGTEPAIVEGESLSRWATRNGCTGGNMTETLFSGDVHHSSLACAGAGVEGKSVLDMRDSSSSSSRFVLHCGCILTAHFGPCSFVFLPCYPLRELPTFLRALPQHIARSTHVASAEF
ncbi:hypothetical protein B0H14DRAFT_3891165 [Mycena olivaceomarginata]|nr:hypothetical protein B0H14DRAFT_3891165 [Mycena olivaceomarginata]